MIKIIFFKDALINHQKAITAFVYDVGTNKLEKIKISLILTQKSQITFFQFLHLMPVIMAVQLTIDEMKK